MGFEALCLRITFLEHGDSPAYPRRLCLVELPCPEIHFEQLVRLLQRPPFQFGDEE